MVENLESLTRTRNACEDQLKKHQRALASYDRRITKITRELAGLERKRDLKAISPRREPNHRKGVVGLDAPLGIGSSSKSLRPQPLLSLSFIDCSMPGQI